MEIKKKLKPQSSTANQQTMMNLQYIKCSSGLLCPVLSVELIYGEFNKLLPLPNFLFYSLKSAMCCNATRRYFLQKVQL